MYFVYKNSNNNGSRNSLCAMLKEDNILFLFSGMWTARNIFIATLAVADSSLCLFAMPMTLVGILTKYWPFGPQTWLLCKVVRSAPAVTIFFSSYTMVVIAIDRQRFIVHSTKRQVSVKYKNLWIRELLRYWYVGPQTWLVCKVVRAVTIFFSSYRMVVIAIDRQQSIVHSTKRQESVKSKNLWIKELLMA